MKYLEETFPGSTDAVGIFTGTLETTQVVAARNKEAMEQLGWNIVYEGTYNPQRRADVAAVPRADAQPRRQGPVLGRRAVEPLEVPERSGEPRHRRSNGCSTDANHYDPQITSIGDAADGTYVRTGVLPVPRPRQPSEQPGDRSSTSS